MAFGIILAVLMLVPLIIHLRGGTIVALSLNAAVVWALSLLAIVASKGSILGSLSPDSAELVACDPAPCERTFQFSANFAVLGAIVGAFALIALVFWALDRWNAPLPHDRLKALFWLLHISILALPFAMYVFFSAGIFDSYAGGPNDLPVFAMSSAIISILCVIAIGGFVIAALGAVFKRLRT
jgi:hypothetical protein